MTNKGALKDYELQFKEWLTTVKKHKKETVSSRVSNIRTIGEYYDILKEFSIDECQGIFDDLRYSKNDGEPKTSIIIEGNYSNGLATYRQALKLFVAFLKDIHYVAPTPTGTTLAKFIGSFDEFKRYVGPKCRNEVNIFCKSARKSHNGICEYCGNKSSLQSAHIEDRLTIIKRILDKHYKIGPDLYEVTLENFFAKFKNEHMPIPDHIFFLCDTCHDKLDKYKKITAQDIIDKRKTSSGTI